MVTVAVKADTSAARAELEALRGQVQGVEVTWRSKMNTIKIGITTSVGAIATVLTMAGNSVGTVISSMVAVISSGVAATSSIATALAATGPWGIAQAAIIAGANIFALGVQTTTMIMGENERRYLEAQAAEMEGWK